MSSDLVIVYHRQPYEEVEVNGKTEFRENKSPNGIVPTLKSFFGKVENAAWVAWKEAEDTSNPGFDRVVEIEDSFGKYTVSRLPLTKEQVRSFYHITSKEAFWPILHGFKEKYNYDPVDWPTFKEVNWAFAEAAAAEAAHGASVWVHDYNLWLVPGYLRQLRPDLRISFYHHTPFPNADMFNVLPWRGEIIDSLLSADVVGFHIPRYASNFVGCVRSLRDVGNVPRVKVTEDLIAEGSALSDRTVPTEIHTDDRVVQLGVTPVGVDVGYISQLAETEETKALAKRFRAEVGDSTMILSVGRTDYTKGGADQLLAFERLLERRPELRGTVRLLHVSVSANRNMTVYEPIQRELEEIAGRINGRFGSFTFQPIALISRAIPFNELVAWYQVADVAWITPLADGMNLVCKEYASARSDGDGVLVLSEFAGAAVELGAAVLTNPFSTRAMDFAIDLALDMPENERRARMELLRAAVAKRDTHHWAKDQLAMLSPKNFGDGTGGSVEAA
ncbi:glucosylglycerol-phosphate synthase [Citreicella sp. SE45]|uniref:Glucosyl-glycerol phosphate synthase n=1 Tax=Salipiger thiooxidans TaxID=282683 RepID=A0A1G7HWX1_9RHOB|nr:glucosylglycerol-phosphate synthase [Salipiger thiooxidans]EEX15102.1 glucosylglycerol-phosphate synthase [Citreicella sp. SE45]NVK59700.1 glucosylglycerol-phosphate synthase [Paracoccaceae bacterium]SDF04746.1 glucosyl-glycerol phosphate synthase [Salipiger thiooxidans]